MNTSSSTAAAPRGTARFVSWTLRALAAAVFLAAGGAKLAAVPAMVAVFDRIGIGQWFRVVTGVVEVVGAVGLLLPRTVGFAGLLLAATMAVAVSVHLFVIGGSPVPALILLLIAASVAWLQRAGIADALRALRGSRT
ncbi:DoxX family protein [Lysobacter sp. K5869]|uniref:DoxX family protein n=1 Tax=Lysobacter sp. K5869 TaxID=2820808 RepID=UPI001C063024|nr:DoxX family protein [Lysobacter sp. K5869]QWP75922.1 DoxX family protein [Lysobacter sp. K5869]